MVGTIVTSRAMLLGKTASFSARMMSSGPIFFNMTSRRKIICIVSGLCVVSRRKIM